MDDKRTGESIYIFLIGAIPMCYINYLRIRSVKIHQFIVNM